MGVMQKRTAQVGILSAERSGARRASGAEQMRAHRHTYGRNGGYSDYIGDFLVAYRPAISCGEPEG